MKISYVAAILLLISTNLFANPADKSKALIVQIVGPKTIISEQFKSIGNLKGYVVKNEKNGKPMIVYADTNGLYVIGGAVYDAQGQDISDQDKQRYIYQKGASQEMPNISKTAFVIQTKKGAPIKHALTVIIEPNCSACHALYKAILPSIESGDVSVRWVLVHFLKPSSEARAASILQAANPVDAIAANEANFDEANEEGGAKIEGPIKPETKQKLIASNTFMSNIGLNATPSILFYDKKGELHILEGFPNDKEAFNRLINQAGDQFDK